MHRKAKEKRKRKTHKQKSVFYIICPFLNLHSKLFVFLDDHGGL